jgi:hypothetical protein
MPRDLSHALKELGRLAAEVQNGTREPWLRFRDEQAAWEFRTAMVVEAFLNRGAATFS